MVAVVLKKPIAKEEEIGIHGAEGFNGIAGDVVLVRGGDGCDN
jgi:hypothetical protein